MGLFVCEALQKRVHGSRDAVEPSQQHDFSIEEVGLERAGRAGQALPRRVALARLTCCVSHSQAFPTTFAVLLLACVFDPGRPETPVTLEPSQLGERPLTGLRAAQCTNDI